MLKREKLLSILCVICLLLSSCSMLGLKPKEGTEATKQTGSNTTSSETENKAASTNSEQTASQKEVNAANVRKISYKNIINAGFYSGFTEKQLAMLEKNGFIIMEPYNFSRMMHQPYEFMEYSEGSMIITTDVVLHMWHVFFSESMKALELTTYLPNLTELSLELEEKAIEAYQNAPDALDYAYSNIIAYFHVANSLLQEDGKNIYWHRGSATLPVEPHGDAMAIAEAEMENIIAEAAQSSALLQRDIDYSQFTVRGHYTSSEALSRYFQAMMWYGFMGFDLQEQPVEAALIADLLAQNKDLMELWQKNYELSALYSGESDDIMVSQMQEVLKAFEGKNLARELAGQAGLNILKKEIEKLPEPRIVAKLSKDNKDFEVGKNFKLMGQRFNVDGYILQNLMEPLLRPMPTSFDVFAAMGSKTAENFLRANYETNQTWKEYDEVLKRMKEEYAAGELTDGDNFYNGWVRAIDRALNYVPEGKIIPHFMTTEAYEYKKINAALGSYAELKHDNILYAKQAMAEMGAPEENLILHYLEPNEELYQELLTLSTHAEKLMKKAGVAKEWIEPLSSIKELMKAFATISRKELNGENLTKEELRELCYAGGLIEYLNSHYIYALATEGFESEAKKSSALIADIATVLARGDLPGGVLEVATGFPYEIYVLCHVNGVDILAKGFVYSSFEFISDKRLTDEDWYKALGLVDNLEWGVPELDLTNYQQIRDLHMEYFKQFSTGEPNQIHHDYEVEVDWPKQEK